MLGQGRYSFPPASGKASVAGFCIPKVKSGVVLRDIRGFGAEMPVAANTVDEGRFKNRRVEVWVY